MGKSLLQLPKTLLIGRISFTIRDLSRDREDSSYGRSSEGEQWIALSRSMSEERRRETFLHEVLHQVLFAGDYDKEADNEQLCTHLAAGLHQVLDQIGWPKA